MKKLWEKGWQMDSLIESFETKDDLLLDQKLVIYDVYGSLAQAKMLTKIGILSKKELSDLTKGLLAILELSESNQFLLKLGDEDIHTKIENFLTAKLGDVGKKIHTGRSRNDQVLAALRLYSKDNLLSMWDALLILIASFQQFALKYEFVPMPGYTHTQKAMPSSVGMWAAAFVEAFLDDLMLLKTVYSLNDMSPLGSAAGYGVPLHLDREYVSKALGFRKVQINSLYCQNSRGKIEASIISAINGILLDINKFATDVVFFTSSEFGYFTVADEFCSGSSIMPQKKNVDVAELLRSKIHITLGNYSQIISLSSNLISGYNRDLQDSKKPLMESLELAQDSIRVANILINNIIPQKEKLESALTPDIFATHKALEMVSQGVPFRLAYETVGSSISSLTSDDSNNLLKKSIHLGGTGNLALGSYLSQIKQEKQEFKTEYKNFKLAINTLVKGEKSE